MSTSHRGERGLELIVGYKLTKAVIEVVFGVVLLFLATTLSTELRQLVFDVRDHLTAAWSIALAERIGDAATKKHLMVVALASLLDGLFSAFEGWALHRRYRWSGYLVIGATAGLLPFEVLALARRFTVGRAALLAVNLSIVAYLVRRRSTL